MVFAVVFFFLFVADGLYWIQTGHFIPDITLSRRVKAVKAAETKKIAAKSVTEGMSWASASVYNEYMSLPEQHRPSIDVVAALRALDVKYGVEALDTHFEDDSGYWNPRTGRRQNSWNCWCKQTWDDEDPGYTYIDYDAECTEAPEFNALRDEISKVKAALAQRVLAEQEYERKIELAGVESDLRSIDDITAALRAESNLITEVTKEISA